MNTNATSLDRLHDIIVPAPVPWWPPAPGWYWVLGFVLALVFVLAFRAFIRWQYNRYRREALAELGRLEAQLQSPADRVATLLALAELLKRTALTAFPREQVATLTGAPWFAFLDRAAKGANFNGGLGAMLENSVYDSRTARLDGTTVNALVSAIRNWIKHHKVRIPPKDATTAKTDSPSRPSLPFVQSPIVQKPC